MKTLLQQKLLEIYTYMKGIYTYMKSSYNKADKASIGYCMPPSKTSSTSNRLHLVQLLMKEFSQTPPHTHYTLKIQQAIANASTTWWYGLITQDEIYLCLFGRGIWIQESGVTMVGVFLSRDIKSQLCLVTVLFFVCCRPLWVLAKYEGCRCLVQSGFGNHKSHKGIKIG